MGERGGDVPNIRRPKKGKQYMFALLACLSRVSKLYFANLLSFSPLVHKGSQRSSRRISPHFLNKVRRGEKGSGEKWMQHLAVKVAAELQQAMYRKKRKGHLYTYTRWEGKKKILCPNLTTGGMKRVSIASSPLPSFPPKKVADGSRLLISLFFFFHGNRCRCEGEREGRAERNLIKFFLPLRRRRRRNEEERKRGRVAMRSIVRY